MQFINLPSIFTGTSTAAVYAFGKSVSERAKSGAHTAAAVQHCAKTA